MSYSLKIIDYLAAAITGRYIRSNIVDRKSNPNYKVGNDFVVDLSTYYQSPLKYRKRFANRYRLGLLISNLGPKISYTSGSVQKEQFVPTTLKLGGAYDFVFGQDQRLSAVGEISKFLLPKSEFTQDADGHGNPGYVIPDEGVLQGILRSFKGFYLEGSSTTPWAWSTPISIALRCAWGIAVKTSPSATGTSLLLDWVSNTSASESTSLTWSIRLL